MQAILSDGRAIRSPGGGGRQPGAVVGAMPRRPLVALLVLAGCTLARSAEPPPAASSATASPRQIPLPSGKFLDAPAPGNPVSTNSLPSAIAVSPDGKTVAVLNAGYGTPTSGGMQSLTLVDRTTGVVTDVPDQRLGNAAAQTAFVGMAWSSDGKSLYVSFGSMSDPEGKGAHATGDGVAVYDVANGTAHPARFLAIPSRILPAGRQATSAVPGTAPGTVASFPAGLSVLPPCTSPARAECAHDRILVAANLSDEAVLLDAQTGAIQRRVDVGAGAWVPSAWPYGAVASSDGRTGWVSLWNGSAVAEVDLQTGVVRRSVALPRATGSVATDPGSHPTAMLLSPDGRRLYVTLANADAVAVIDTHTGAVTRWSTTIGPAATDHGGSVPTALALAPDGKHLYVADAAADAVDVLDTHDGHSLGFIPTEWYPTALAAVGDDLWIATGKGKGTGPNNGPPPAGSHRKHPYIASILPGSVARVTASKALVDLPALTAEVKTANRMSGDLPTIAFTGKNPFHHAIYIIKENRTYDQVLGDLGVGNGDPSLTMYGADITPNEHALARQFGVLDNFWCSGEVSGDGHVWSMAATSSDYTEKTWQIGYRSDERTYDYEGEVLGAWPLEQGQADIDTPGTGYLWSAAEKQGISHRNYGEFVSSVWCDDPDAANPGKLGTPLIGGASCPAQFVQPGQPIPDAHGGPAHANPWPWPVPIVARDVPTTSALRDHYDPYFADFRLDYPDQMRTDEFVWELGQWTAARAAAPTGPDPMPALIVLRLSNDHTSGTRPGSPSPAAAVADNDLALGRLVEAVSHSPYWDDTAIFVLEDDAQDGADHVDAHRSPAFVISKYSPSSASTPLVDSTFYTTVSVIHTLEAAIGLEPMNDNDAWAPVIGSLVTGPGAQPPYTANASNRDNGLIYQMNTPTSPGSGASLLMDFKHADAVDTALLNRILWADARGDEPYPGTSSAD